LEDGAKLPRRNIVTAQRHYEGDEIVIVRGAS
jgi:hypothetical protein